MKFNKFVPLTKMEDQPDGTLFVYGTVTAEQPDLDQEVCDYAGTKPLYQAKAAAMFKLTSAVDGMTPSIMPMREMHQLKAVGAGRSIDFDDAAKAIKMGFHVVDTSTVAKFRAGVLVGFSQGGAYVGELVPDPTFAGCKRYIADPQEVSAVDTPCLPSALVESMKGRTVTLTKAGGVTEEVHLSILPIDQNRLIKIERTIASFEEAIQAQGLAITEACATISLQKGLYEEAVELAAKGGEGAPMKITTQADLTKAAKTLMDHMDKLKELHKAHGEHMEKAFEGMKTKHEQMGDNIDKCMKAAKDAGAGEQPEEGEKAAPAGELGKAAQEQIAALAKQVADLTAAMSKIPAADQGVNSGAAHAIVKGVFAELLPAAATADNRAA